MHRIIVTRHPAVVDFIRKCLPEFADAPVIEGANSEDVAGAWVAGKIDLQGYRHDLLYRPQVSIRLGAWYLGWLLHENGNDWIAALVGYNAGPGNLQRMTGGNPITDYDLFYETISIAPVIFFVWSTAAM